MSIFFTPHMITFWIFIASVLITKLLPYTVISAMILFDKKNNVSVLERLIGSATFLFIAVITFIILAGFGSILAIWLGKVFGYPALTHIIFVVLALILMHTFRIENLVK